MPEYIERIKNDPVALAIVVAVAVLLVGVIIFLVLRRSRKKSEKEAHIRENLVAMERERQFADAADQVRFQRDVSQAALEIGGLLREFLQVWVVAIYAGREGDDNLSDVLPAPGPLSTGPLDRLRSQSLPATVPALVLNEYKQPQIARLQTPAQSPANDSTQAEPVENGAEQKESDLSEGANGQPLSTGQLSTGQLEGAAQETVSNIGGEVLLVPWRAAFGWRGLIVTALTNQPTIEAMRQYQEPLTRLTDRLAIALEFERDRAELFALDDRATRVAAFAHALIASLEDPQMLSSIAREVTKLIGADSAALWRIERGSNMVRMIAAYGLKSAEFLPLPLGQGLAGGIASSGETIALEDAPSDPRCIFPREARESGMVAYLGVPISSNDQIVGVVEAHSTQRHKWSEGDERSLKSAASLIADVLKNTDTRGNRLRVESAYLGLSEALQRLRSPEEVMEAAVEVLGHALGVSRALVVELDDQGQPMRVRFEYRSSSTSALGATFKAGAFDKLSTGTEPVAINDSREQSLIGTETAAALQILSELAVPVRLERQTRAVLYLHQCDRVREWHHEEIEFADRVARQLALSLGSVRSLEHANTDIQSAREEARRATEATNRLQLLVNSLPEMVLGLDREGRLSFFNPSARDRLGLKMDELGRQATLTESLSTADENLWDRILQSNEIFRTETRLMKVVADGEAADTPEGSTLPVSISATAIRTGAGEISGHLVMLTDLRHIDRGASDATKRIRELEQHFAAMERELAEARNAENMARAMLAKASAAEAKARAEADVLKRSEADTRLELERLRDDQARAHASARQLLEINRLKSEFIVNAGREIESSLHSVLGFAELLEQGSYGELTAEQREAIKSLYGWGQRIRGDVDTLIEYGSTRSRRLDEG